MNNAESDNERRLDKQAGRQNRKDNWVIGTTATILSAGLVGAGTATTSMLTTHDPQFTTVSLRIGMLVGGVLGFGWAVVRGHRQNLQLTEQLREQASLQQRQQHIRQQAAEINNQVKAVLAGAPTMLADADRFLATAEQYRQDGATTPFWDAIEGAVNALGGLYTDHKMLTELADEYDCLLQRFSECEGVVSDWPAFAVEDDVQHYAATDYVLQRLDDVAYNALSNQTFALIFEQRRHRALATSWWPTIGDALNIATRRFDLTGERSQFAPSDQQANAETTRQRMQVFHEHVRSIARESA